MRRLSADTVALSATWLNLLKLLEDFPMGRGILLWLLGVPIPVIILIFLFFR